MDVADIHAAAYDRWATRFDAINAAMPEELETLGRAVLAAAVPSPRVLDVGCGTGRDLAWFEDHGAVGTGVDVSAAMLELARTRVSGSLLQMDMRRLDFEDETFDVVWSIASLLHLPKADAAVALAGFRRVVCRAGVIAIAVKRGTGEGWECTGPAPRRWFARYEPDELRNALAGAGLAIETVEVRTGRDCEWLHALAVPAVPLPA